MSDDRMPPRNKYFLCLAKKAAPVKHVKIVVEPRNATITMLKQPIIIFYKIAHDAIFNIVQIKYYNNQVLILCHPC